ncbi:MAG: hypothetical protein QOD76_1349, partial [Solirubrobacteraceae bacterium]|nr:hypothetical protein [Solirubrobacteraceae bacterium]
PVSGSIDAATWQALLRYAPTVRSSASAARASRGTSGPPSAALPPVADELRGGAPK